jgi:hypothetical protein
MDADGSCSSTLVLKTKLLSITIDVSVFTDALII